MTALLAAISSVFTNCITLLGDVVNGLTATDGALAGALPFIGLGMGISIFSLMLGKLRSLIWGM